METQLPLLGLIMGVLGLAGTVWWRLQTHISGVRIELEVRIHAASAQASMASMQLADYRTYVAEHYISKQGFRETMDTLSATLHTINTNLTHLNERIDRVIDNQHTAPRQKERSSS
jgi:hypothetical protein